MSALAAKGITVDLDATFEQAISAISNIVTEKPLISSTTSVTFNMGAGGGRSYQEKVITLPSNYDAAKSYILLERVNAGQNDAATDVGLLSVKGRTVKVWCSCSNNGDTVVITIRFVGVQVS